jgi:ATP-dependent RNA helicase DeaD
MLFTELSLKSSSLQAIEAMGFQSPTDIQEQSIPLLIDNDVDFVGQAQTGTGKTAAFTLPLLEKIDFSSNKIQALVLAPTRELANQICEEIKKLSKFEPVKTMSVYGGTPVYSQLKQLKKIRPQIVVGTPGRTIDFINRGALDFNDCRHVILDEADEMLDMGFFDDVQEILSAVEKKKIWMFSATMPKPIVNLVNRHFDNPEHVKVTKKILTADSVDQQFVVIRRRDHAEALCRYLDFNDHIYAIVFSRTKVGAKELMDELNSRGFKADALHGDMSQEQRDITMRRFKEKKVHLLVCTDVAARGIDVNDLTHVINYGLPQDNESYVHRIGRTGRGGSKGIALSIVEPSETRRLRDIERITKAKIQKIQLPKVNEICERLTKKAFTEFEVAIDKFHHDEDELFIKFKDMFEDADTEELIKGIYSSLIENSVRRYRNAKSLDDSGLKERSRRDGLRDRGSRDRGSRERGGRGAAQAGYERFFMNMGRGNGLQQPGDLIRLVSRNIGVKGSEVGRIDIMDSFCFFEMPEQFKDKVMGMNDKTYHNEVISVEVAKASAGDRKSGGGRGRGTGRRNGNRSRRRY